MHTENKAVKTVADYIREGRWNYITMYRVAGGFQIGNLPRVYLRRDLARQAIKRAELKQLSQLRGEK